MLEVKFKLNINGIMKELTMGILMMPLFERLLYAVGGANEGKLSGINVENGCDEKGEDVPEEVTPAKNFT